jgi:hypothetical protein
VELLDDEGRLEAARVGRRHLHASRRELRARAHLKGAAARSGGGVTHARAMPPP